MIKKTSALSAIELTCEVDEKNYIKWFDKQ